MGVFYAIYEKISYLVAFSRSVGGVAVADDDVTYVIQQ